MKVEKVTPWAVNEGKSKKGQHTAAHAVRNRVQRFDWEGNTLFGLDVRGTRWRRPALEIWLALHTSAPSKQTAASCSCCCASWRQ